METYNFSALRNHNWKTLTARAFDTIAGVEDPALGDVIQRATYDTTAAGLTNNVYGAVLYPWYNKEHRWLDAIPQVDRFSFNGNFGATIPKAMRVAHSPVQLDTHSEGGSISTARTMSVEEFSLEVKRSEAVAEVSDLMDLLPDLEDAVSFDDLWELQQEQLPLAIDREGIASAVNTADSAYSSTDTITKLDRAIASQDEENNADDTDDNSYSDGDLDYGTIDRSDDSWGDAYVDHNGVSGNRQLTRDLMDNFLNGLADNGSVDPWQESVILTTRKPANVLSDLMADADRATRITFDGGSSGTDSVNDAETLAGLAGTTRFRHYDGIPVIPNQNGPQDGIGRIFVLPMSEINGEPRIAIENYSPPYMEQAGRGQPQGYLSLDEYKDKALLLMEHELVIRDAASCGKLRDLAE